jgi:hypothetical protein
VCDAAGIAKIAINAKIAKIENQLQFFAVPIAANRLAIFPNPGIQSGNKIKNKFS